MSSITSDEVKKVAHLARLNLQPEEIEPFKGHLNNILHLVAKMDEVDISGLESLAHPLEVTQPLRDDEVATNNKRDEYQKLALTENDLYLVPKVIAN